MATQADSHSLIQKLVLLTLLVSVHAILQVSKDVCQRKRCPGPLRYYEDLGCTPVYRSPGDCCAKRYDCSHLENTSKTKCHVNDYEYSVGEKLRDEDSNPCDKDCVCETSDDGTASFVCAQIDCVPIDKQPPPNCYISFSHDQCCPKLICLKEGKERATCKVDGRIYKDGEYFRPKSEPEKECYCAVGYKGENVEPFCKKPGHKYCAPLFMNATAIYRNCAPSFHVDQNPQRDCTSNFTCHNTNDIVVRHRFTAVSAFGIGKDKGCRFSGTSMHIGDEVYQIDADNFDCVLCTCEVPPIPTCQRRSEKECDVIKYLSARKKILRHSLT